MKLFVILILAAALISLTLSASADLSFYHTSEEVDKEMSQLVSNCHGIIKEHSVSKVFKGKVDKNKYKLLKYYDIRDNNHKYAKENVYILSGEHPRELIAVEMALYFMKYLCENTEKDPEVKKILAHFNLRVIVNANPLGRQKVEQGEFCRRSNLNNVDINRNWNYFWGKDIGVPKEEFPGEKPFSEVETKFVMKTLKKFNAKLFLSIHSGFFGLFLPYAYNLKEGKTNNYEMKTILNKIKSKFCSICNVGAPSLIIGYKSSGTSMDYAYNKLKIPYSFAWEIYSNEHVFPEMQSSIQGNQYLSSFLASEEKILSKNLMRDLMFGEKKNPSDLELGVCHALFNPLIKPQYDFLVNNWTKALNHMLILYITMNKN